LGLLLALPLTVVGQVWLKEVIIIDILDRWHSPPENQAELVIVSDSYKAAESSEETEPVTEEDAAIDDKPSADELDKKA
jgi:hypothetical protein